MLVLGYLPPPPPRSRFVPGAGAGGTVSRSVLKRPTRALAIIPQKNLVVLDAGPLPIFPVPRPAAEARGALFAMAATDDGQNVGRLRSRSQAASAV